MRPALGDHNSQARETRLTFSGIKTPKTRSHHQRKGPLRDSKAHVVPQPPPPGVYAFYFIFNFEFNTGVVLHPTPSPNPQGYGGAVVAPPRRPCKEQHARQQHTTGTISWISYIYDINLKLYQVHIHLPISGPSGFSYPATERDTMQDGMGPAPTHSNIVRWEYLMFRLLFYRLSPALPPPLRALLLPASLCSHA